MRREVAGAGAALQSAAEPIVAARGGAGAPAEHRPAPSQHSWPGLLEELRGERRALLAAPACACSGSIAGAAPARRYQRIPGRACRLLLESVD